MGYSLIDKGHTATVFGATGFLGRYIVNRLGIKKVDRRLDNRLMRSSNARMYCCHTVPGGDGEEAFESHRRSWKGHFHGQKHS